MMQHHAVVSLGSNLDDRLEALQGAVDALLDTPGTTLVGLSPVYETTPVGGPPQPDFLNAVLVVRTGLSADALLDLARGVEDAMERTREQRWGPRTIDVDLVLVGDEHVERPDLTVPHPRAHERAFVLVPWREVEPNAELPGYGPVEALVDRLGDQGVRRRDDLPLRLPA